MAKRGKPKKQPDPAILRLARALALQAAREDHKKEMLENGGYEQSYADELVRMLD